MNLLSPQTIKELLAMHNTMPSKRMGQNFLIDASVLQKVVTTADLQPTDVILEIGPGIGTLTRELAKKAKIVIAVEKDRAMVHILQETLRDYKNIEIMQGDILKDFKFNNFKLNSNFKFQISNYKLVANLPYYITSPIIRMFLEIENPPTQMVLMVQKEVAQRICAKPPNMSILAVSVQFYAKPEIISYVSKGCFWPSPKVDSAIIKITPSKEAPREQVSGRFFDVVKAGFKQPRKQLVNNLSISLKKSKPEIVHWLTENNIDPKQRPETLSINDWKGLTSSFNRVLMK